MPNDRQIARQQIEKLIQFFDSNIYQFKSPSFNETQARQQLIDPFFESLGWDMHNRSMKPLFRQEVVPESRMKSSIAREVKEQEPLFPKKETLDKEYKEYTSILDYIAEDEYKANSQEAVKKPDYRFRIGGQTKFFVEAKKPSVDLAKSQSAIFQVKRYGFSGRVPLAILTDFEEFRAFDCTQRPAFEKPKLGVIHDFDLTYKQYLDLFERLYDTFSRDAVAGGSLETLTKKMMLKRTGDFALDHEFLEDLSKWREELARDIAKHPKNRRLLNDYTLNEAVQRILDRIVFIRVCEDREIEVENTLLAILRMWKERPGSSLYSLLNDLFKQRRALYNGLLFSPHQCEELEIGNEVLIKILENLNYPFSPYHFNEIGVEILGSIYEKFLGKTIHLAPKNVVIKDKPEVRKAGGVYYTPQYIVNYIVDNTLGKLLYEEYTVAAIGDRGLQGVVTAIVDRGLKDAEDGNHPTSKTSATEIKKLKLTPKQAAKLKIIDIACGSGSFLLGAFQKLIDYHIEWYTVHPEDIKTENNVPDAYKDTNSNYHLSPRKKRDILVNNIYGVDIDRQAVEVTQMSLYLKVLEGENAETLNPQMTLALKEVYLPSLAKNIKCGNSLIGTDFTSQGEMFDDEARRKVNPFDWEMEFPEILGSYGKPSEGSPSGTKKPSEGSHGFDVVIGNPPYLFITEIEQNQKNYFFSKYRTPQYRFDVYGIFIEIAVCLLLNKNGYLGYIIPHTLLNNDSFEKLRQLLLGESFIKKVVDIGPGVFDGAKNETMILVLTGKNFKKESDNTKVVLTNLKEFPIPHKTFIIDQELWKTNPKSSWLINVSTTETNIISRVENGWIKLGEYCTINQGLRTGDNEKYLAPKQKSGKWKPAAGGKQVGRYEPLEEGLFVYYVPEVLDAPRKKVIFDSKEKLVVQEIRNITLPRRIIATYDSSQYYCLQSTNVINLKVSAGQISIKYLLTILNSSVINFFFRQRFAGNNHIASNQLSEIPIRTIDFNNPAEKKMHDDLVSLVEKMLELNKQLQKAHFDSEKEPIERQIAATDNKIDELVYQLYGLTEEEIKIVERKSS